MKLTIALVLTASAATSYAKDSTWLLCKGVGDASQTKLHVVASLFEHRGAADRDLGATLLYGDRVMRGAIVGTSSAPFLGKPTALTLASIAGKHRVVFKGTVTLAEDMSTFSLDGALDLSYGDDPLAKPYPFKAQLACEVLDDAAIGH